MQEQHGRGALVIGAGEGLGREISVLLAQEGYVVGLVGHRHSTLAETHDAIGAVGGQSRIVVASAKDSTAMVAAVAALDEVNSTAVLVYNAVTRSDRTLAQVGADEFKAAMNVNVVTPVMVVQAVLPSLIANAGDVLLVGGGSALNPTSASGVLASGKAALRAASFALSQELEPQGVRVRTITIAGLMDPKGPLVPQAVARALLDQRDHAEVELVYRG